MFPVRTHDRYSMKVTSIKRLALAMGRSLSIKELEDLHETLLDTLMSASMEQVESKDDEVLDAFADMLDTELTTKKNA